MEHRIGSSEGVHLRALLSWEDQRSATLEVDDTGGLFRPVLPIEPGIVRSWGAELRLPPGPRGLRASSRITGSRLNGREWMRADAEAGYSRSAEWADLDVALKARVGGSWGDPPPQAYVLLGGRGTLPGHTHRGLVGNRYWLSDARLGHRLRSPWFGIHATAAVGQAFIDGPDVLPPGWVGRANAGVRGSVGLGVDVLWDVLTIDVARGLGPGGDWVLLVGVNPRFHPWL